MRKRSFGVLLAVMLMGCGESRVGTAYELSDQLTTLILDEPTFRQSAEIAKAGGMATPKYVDGKIAYLSRGSRVRVIGDEFGGSKVVVEVAKREPIHRPGETVEIVDDEELAGKVGWILAKDMPTKTVPAK